MSKAGKISMLIIALIAMDIKACIDRKKEDSTFIIATNTNAVGDLIIIRDSPYDVEPVKIIEKK